MQEIRFTQDLDDKLMLLGCHKYEINNFTTRYILGSTIIGYKVNEKYVSAVNIQSYVPSNLTNIACGCIIDSNFNEKQYKNFFVLDECVKAGTKKTYKSNLYLRRVSNNVLGKYKNSRVLDFDGIFDSRDTDVIAFVNNVNTDKSFLINKSGKKIIIGEHLQFTGTLATPVTLLMGGTKSAIKYCVKNINGDIIFIVDKHLNVLHRSKL